MELTFVDDGKGFAAEFDVTGDFNLHIEKPSGKVLVYQRTAGSKYSKVSGFSGNYGFFDDKVVDYDFTGLVYPKSIRVECEKKPDLAVVTFA